jgi:hypothetical protein
MLVELLKDAAAAMLVMVVALTAHGVLVVLVGGP